VIAGQGEINLIVLIGIVWASAILGDTTSFFIGRRLGRGFVLRHGPKVKIDEDRLEQVEAYFERHGGKTILIGRFIGLVRALAPFVAGSSGIAYRRFIPYSIIGCGLWATTFCVLGYVFYASFDRVADIAGKATFGFGLTVGTIVVAVVAYRELRHAERRRQIVEWMDRKPVLRQLVAVGRPIRRRVLAPLWAAVAPQAPAGAPRPVAKTPSRVARPHRPAAAVPAPAATVSAQRSPDVDVAVDPALVNDLDLIEAPNQGKPVQVEGELRAAPFLAASPSRYRLLAYDGPVLEMVCHVHGRSAELRRYIGKKISIRGREFWVELSDMPVVVVGQVVPLAPDPVDEPVLF